MKELTPNNPNKCRIFQKILKDTLWEHLVLGNNNNIKGESIIVEAQHRFQETMLNQNTSPDCTENQ